MPQNCRVTVTNETQTLLPEDYIVNTFTFRWVSPGSPSNFTYLADMLKDFYSTTPAGSSTSIRALYSGNVFTNRYWIRVYDLSEPEPRSPIFEELVTAAVGSAESLPREVALVMSFQAAQVSGIPQRRRRNRVYLGPFVETQNDNAGRPTAALRATIARAARDMIDASTGLAPWQWNINSSFYADDNVPVLDGWVDNTWDTQRRRGPRSTDRTSFTRTTPA